MSRRRYARQVLAAIENAISLAHRYNSHFERMPVPALRILSLWHTGSRTDVNPRILQDDNMATRYSVADEDRWSFKMPFSRVSYEVIEGPIWPPLPDDIVEMLVQERYREAERAVTDRRDLVQTTQRGAPGSITTINP